ncbi:MAG: hypothetical protein P9M14_09725, partial [Candidatus Alcyoniella australis]|nr:hypothetical protein [Candidatus Alcyoniella australis]
DVRLVAPPVSKREGCDLALEFNAVEQLSIRRELERTRVEFIGIELIQDNAPQPLQLVQHERFGDCVMVRAANMKLTFDSVSGRIVNISGGGCPDVPYLYAMLVGQDLHTAQPPRELGHTLCALMLDRAFQHARELAGEA